MPDRFLLFVSYSCVDKRHPFLDDLRRFFDSPGVERVATYFMAEDAPDYGSDFVTKVLDALGKADAVLPFITEASETAAWVNQEIGFARGQGTLVLPAFDPALVKRLPGMIQTTDACPVDDPAKVQALFERVLELARQDPVSRKRRLSITVAGVWWSEHKGAYPLYVRLELTHVGKEPDAIKRVFLECPTKTVEMERVDHGKLGELKPADYKDVVLKFLPGRSVQLERMRLVVETVRGIKADDSFEHSASGWRPPDLWEKFKPY